MGPEPAFLYCCCLPGGQQTVHCSCSLEAALPSLQCCADTPFAFPGLSGLSHLGQALLTNSVQSCCPLCRPSPWIPGCCFRSTSSQASLLELPVDLCFQLPSGHVSPSRNVSLHPKLLPIDSLVPRARGREAPRILPLPHILFQSPPAIGR